MEKRACNVYHQKRQIDVEREICPNYPGYGAISEPGPLEPKEEALYWCTKTEDGHARQKNDNA